MKKYAQITDENTKTVSVGTGTNTAFYESIGMTEMDVEQGYDGNWYVAGYAPKPSEEFLFETLRSARDTKLNDTDKYSLPDFPLSDEERESILEYRQRLRDLPKMDGAPWDGGGEKTPWPVNPLK